MAKIKLNPMFVGISGTMGDVVFKKSRSGEVIVTKRPDMSGVEPSEAQKAQRERLKFAAAYARAAVANPDVRAVYEEMAARERKSVFAAARDDYLRGNDLLPKK